MRELIFYCIRSGKSIVFAMEITSRREFWWHGQSNRLYSSVYFFVMSASSSSMRITRIISARF